jgi:glycolate oxidase iron-sulfur subunit
MKDYGHLLDTATARSFSARVLDISEWLADRVDTLPDAPGPRRVVIVQDPCHLRHVQRAHQPVRTLLGHVAEVVELDDDGLCCGAGGAYSVLQPELAGGVRARKVAAVERAVERSGAVVAAVASANPGCSMHLAAVLDLPVRHPVDIVAEALGIAEALRVDGR